VKYSSKIKESLSKGERDLINLSTGKKTPKTEKERKLLQEIETIKKDRGIIIIPHD